MSSNTTLTKNTMCLRSHTRTLQSQPMQEGSSLNEELSKDVQMSINLDNLSEDQRELKNIRVAVVENQDCINDLVAGDTVADLSESLFTNNDFQYSDDKVFQHEGTPKHLTEDKDTIPPSVPDSIRGAQFIVNDIKYISAYRNEYEESPKKRKLEEAELYIQKSTFEAKAVITSQATTDRFTVSQATNDRCTVSQATERFTVSQGTNDKFTVSQATDDKLTNSPILTGAQVDDKFNKPKKLVETLDRRATVLEALETMDLEKINEIEGNIFKDPEIRAAYMQRLNSLISSFKANCIEGIHELENEIKLEEIQTRQRQEMLLSSPSLGVDSFLVELKPEKPEEDDIGLEELSVIFSDMYKTLCDSNFESCDY